MLNMKVLISSKNWYNKIRGMFFENIIKSYKLLLRLIVFKINEVISIIPKLTFIKCLKDLNNNESRG
jgi:hypothetical protein